MIRLRVIGLLVVGAVAIASWAATCAAWRADRIMAGVAPLDPRRFEAFTLLAVGTGGAYENPDRGGPAIGAARDDVLVLVDAGRRVAEGLRAARVPVAQPRLVLLTSLLPENTVGLDDLLLTGWLDGRETPLRVVGPAGTVDLAARLEAAHAGAIAARAQALGLPPAGAHIEAVEVGDGFETSEGALSLRAALLPGGPLTGLAWRISADGRSAVVAPEGWAPDAVVGAAQGADLLVHEAVFVPDPALAAEIGLDVSAERLRRESALHTSIDAVGEIAQRAGVGTLVLVRLRPPPVYSIQITGIVDDRFDGRILIPEDGDEIRP